MKLRKILVMFLSISVIATGAIGCSNKNTTKNDITSENSSESKDDEEIVVKITNIDDDKITAVVGTLNENKSDKNGEIPEKPDSNAPDNANGEKPDLPDGEKPEDADGNAPDIKPGSFEESDEEVTFTIDDNEDVAAADLEEGMIISLTLKENVAYDVTIVSKAGMKGEFSGKHDDSSSTNNSSKSNGSAATTITSDTTLSSETYTSDGDDENALRVDGADVTIENSTINKESGSSSNTENGDFYGANAGLLACNGANVDIKDITVTTNTVNGNGIFSYGEGTIVNVSDSKIVTSSNNSGGLMVTGGATLNASNLDVETAGNSSAAIRSDRGGGNLNVSGGKYVSNGLGSPAIYSTANIVVDSAELISNNSEAVVVEGKNSVTITNSSLTGNMTKTHNGKTDNLKCIMLYQSMSGDADEGQAEFSAKDSSITSLTGDMFYVTNTSAKIELENVGFTLATDVFLRAEGNSS